MKSSSMNHFLGGHADKKKTERLMSRKRVGHETGPHISEYVCMEFFLCFGVNNLSQS